MGRAWRVKVEYGMPRMRGWQARERDVPGKATGSGSSRSGSRGTKAQAGGPSRDGTGGRERSSVAMPLVVSAGLAVESWRRRLMDWSLWN